MKIAPVARMLKSVKPQVGDYVLPEDLKHLVAAFLAEDSPALCRARVEALRGQGGEAHCLRPKNR